MDRYLMYSFGLEKDGGAGFAAFEHGQSFRVMDVAAEQHRQRMMMGMDSRQDVHGSNRIREDGAGL